MMELKHLITKSGGLPVGFKELVGGESILKDDQLLQVTSPSSGSFELCRALQQPETEVEFNFDARWAIFDGSGNLLGSFT